MKYCLIALIALLAGCTFLKEDSSYVKISEGSAQGLVEFVTGKARYCMVSSNNMEGVIIDKVTYVDGVCTVTWHSIVQDD